MKFNSPFDADRKISPLVPVLAGVLIILIDWITPPPIMVSVFFVIPILMAAWYNGLRWALALSIALPLARCFVATYIEAMWSLGFNLINAFDRSVVFVIVSYITSKLSDSVKHMQREVKVLEGLLPICANCKKIRDDKEVWQQLETYITEHSETQFTHSICPDCQKLLYGKYIRKS